MAKDQPGFWEQAAYHNDAMCGWKSGMPDAEIKKLADMSISQF